MIWENSFIHQRSILCVSWNSALNFFSMTQECAQRYKCFGYIRHDTISHSIRVQSTTWIFSSQKKTTFIFILQHKIIKSQFDIKIINLNFLSIYLASVSTILWNTSKFKRLFLSKSIQCQVIFLFKSPDLNSNLITQIRRQIEYCLPVYCLWPLR